MNWFMGLDSSTQSLSAVVINPAKAVVVDERSINFGVDLPQYHSPQGFLEHQDPLTRHADPRLWVAALDLLFERMKGDGLDLSRIRGISGSGQQHGTVYLNAKFLAGQEWRGDAGLAAMLEPMLSRPTAPIWMDSSTSAECREITQAAGGAEQVRTRTGSHATERFSGPQIRKFYKENLDAYSQTAVVHLVSSFMCSLLAGKSAPIDVGDGAGMNLLSLASRGWDPTMLDATAPGLHSRLPAVGPSYTVVGPLWDYFSERYGFRRGLSVVAWSGDNPCSLIGVGGWRPGVAVVSLGTSDTYFASMEKPTVDPDGYGHVFGNPAGGFMSLICFKNGALAREQVRNQCQMTWAEFDRACLAAPAGNHGNMMLPYFIPEITPLVLNAQPVYKGSDAFVNGQDQGAVVRAVVEAQALTLRLHSGWIEKRPSVLRVTGGGSASTGICQVLADVFNARVERLDVGKSAALGAAMRAAHAAGNLSWEELTAKFSCPAPGMDVVPQPRDVATYETVAADFAAFMKQHVG
ncbi:MAG: hypothetical protein A3K18_29130 [Lentisphaerae bacterium RIFOXYA12_64_32]|nr:MAG: hypothetical protein A3K18_29130 [Lentisphaerae bacterium RIFOXYA12_64_32]